MNESGQPTLFGGEVFREMADSGTGSQIRPALRRELAEMVGDCCGHQRRDHRGGECRICRVLGLSTPDHDLG